MKSRKLLALFLAIFMLASMIVPASAETITPDVNDTEATNIGYDAALVDKADLTRVDDIKTYDANNKKSAYKITDVAGWNKFDSLITGQKNTNFVGVTVYLANDLDFKNDIINSVGTAAITDMTAPSAFAGVFDGQGHSIKNVTVRPKSLDQVNNKYFGLFGVISGAVGSEAGVKNLVIDSSVTLDPFKTVDGTDISNKTNAAYNVGGLVGTVNGFTGDTAVADETPTVALYNVCNNADINFDGQRAGGLVAYAERVILNVTNCTNNGDITQVQDLNAGSKTYNVGGLIGSIAASYTSYYTVAEIENCRNAGTITTEHQKAFIGGIVGYIGWGESADTLQRKLAIKNCINNGDVVFTGTTRANLKYSGIFGMAEGRSGREASIEVTFDGCTNYGVLNKNSNDTTNTDIREISNPKWGTQTNCLAAAGQLDPTYTMVAKYYQMSNKTYKNTEDADCYSLRLVALHNGDLTDLDSYSYDVTIKYGDNITASANTGKLFTVKTSIVVDNMGEGATVITNEMLGCDYISAVRIDNIPVEIGEITVTIVPTMTKDGVDIEAAPITFTVNPAVYA